jgi:hypothetical protein
MFLFENRIFEGALGGNVRQRGAIGKQKVIDDLYMTVPACCLGHSTTRLLSDDQHVESTRSTNQLLLRVYKRLWREECTAYSEKRRCVSIGSGEGRSRGPKRATRGKKRGGIIRLLLR